MCACYHHAHVHVHALHDIHTHMPLTLRSRRLAASPARAQIAIDYCKANAPLNQDLTSDDVGATAAFLCSPMSNAVTGITMYVDNGMHAMGMVQAKAVDEVRAPRWTLRPPPPPPRARASSSAHLCRRRRRARLLFPRPCRRSRAALCHRANARNTRPWRHPWPTPAEVATAISSWHGPALSSSHPLTPRSHAWCTLPTSCLVAAGDWVLSARSGVATREVAAVAGRRAAACLEGASS